MERFIANDQDVMNSYGFYVLTSGISMVRFASNPVMLDEHNRSNKSVIGSWVDWATEEGLLYMKPVFDSEDPEAAIIEGKVKRGFIKGCSMGIIWNQADLEWIGDKLVLTKCELFEVSIVAVPSNRNAIHLYNSDLQLLTDDEVTSTLSLIPNEIKIDIDMKKILLSAAVLSALSIEASADGADASVVEAKVLGLSNKLEALEAENRQLKEAETAKLSVEKESLIDKAISSGQIKKEQKETFMALEIGVAKAIIEGIPTATSLSHQINNLGAGGSEVKTEEDFMKLSLEAKLAFKANHKDEYLKIFNAKNA